VVGSIEFPRAKTRERGEPPRLSASGDTGGATLTLANPHGTQGGEEARGGGGGGREEAEGREAAAGGQVGRQGGRREEGQEEGQEERGDVQDLHLQGAEAGAPRHRHLLQGHVHHELLHQRHLREARRRVRQARSVQQEAHHHLPRDPDLRPPRPPRRARQARRLRGHQGRHQVHQRLDGPGRSLSPLLWSVVVWLSQRQ
jgi:hypothetical protein